jgi:hypothetical protein
MGHHKTRGEGAPSRAKPLGQRSEMFGKKANPQVADNDLAEPGVVEELLREGNDTEKHPYKPSDG